MEKCVYRAWRLASLRSIQSVTSKPSFSSSTMAPTWHGYSSAHSGSRAMPDSPRRSFWKWSSDPSPRLVTDPMPVMTIFFFGAASADMDSDEELWGDRRARGRVGRLAGGQAVGARERFFFEASCGGGPGRGAAAAGLERRRRAPGLRPWRRRRSKTAYGRHGSIQGLVQRAPTRSMARGAVDRGALLVAARLGETPADRRTLLIWGTADTHLKRRSVDSDGVWKAAAADTSTNSAVCGRAGVSGAAGPEPRSASTHRGDLGHLGQSCEKNRSRLKIRSLFAAVIFA